MDIAFTIMKWPLVACLLLPGVLVYLGLHIVRREIIFVDLALAQVSALGTCLCVMLGHEHDEIHTFFWSVGFTLVGAAIFSLTRSEGRGRVPQEALIGIVYVVAAAAGILLLSRAAQGNEELKKTLVGDVLTVSWSEIWKTFVLFAMVGLAHYLFRQRFIMLSFEPDRARATGMALRWWDFLFYALFGMVVTSFVHIGGVLLTFSYLIVPAVCANLLARSLRVMLALGWIVATLASLVGLTLSYKLDLPTGAAIVCALGAALILVGIVARLRHGPGPAPADPAHSTPAA